MFVNGLPPVQQGNTALSKKQAGDGITMAAALETGEKLDFKGTGHPYMRSWQRPDRYDGGSCPILRIVRSRFYFRSRIC